MEGVTFPWARPPRWAQAPEKHQAGRPRLGAQVGIRGTWGWGMALGRLRPRCVRVPRAAIGGTLGWQGARPWLLNGLRERSPPSPGGPVSWGLWVEPAVATSGDRCPVLGDGSRGEVRAGAEHRPAHSPSRGSVLQSPLPGALAGPAAGGFCAGSEGSPGPTPVLQEVGGCRPAAGHRARVLLSHSGCFLVWLLHTVPLRTF